MKETWKKLEFNPFYMVSNLGNVTSLDRITVAHRKSGDVKVHYKAKLLKQCLTNDGYHYVCIALKRYLVHLLVLSTFSPTDNTNLEVNHIDEDKSNNCLSNLEWCTHRYNLTYGTRIERFKASMKARKASK